MTRPRSAKIAGLLCLGLLLTHCAGRSLDDQPQLETSARQQAATKPPVNLYPASYPYQAANCTQPEKTARPEKNANPGDKEDIKEAAAKASTSSKAATPVRAATPTPVEQATGRVLGRTEARGDSLEKCAYTSIPDLFLSGGAVAFIPNPLTPVIAAAFVGGHYYSCYEMRQKDLVHEPDFSAAIKTAADEARRATAADLKADFARLRQQLKKESDDTERSIAALKESIKEAASAEQKAVEKAGAHVMKELYDELEMIRNAKIHIYSDDHEEYLPNSRSRLQKGDGTDE